MDKIFITNVTFFLIVVDVFLDFRFLREILVAFFTLITRAQSFTTLKADLCQDNINGGFAFSRCLNGTFL